MTRIGSNVNTSHCKERSFYCCVTLLYAKAAAAVVVFVLNAVIIVDSSAITSCRLLRVSVLAAW